MGLRRLCVWLFVVLATSNTIFASGKTGDKRLEELKKLQTRQGDVINISDDRYETLVFGAPRPYHLFVLFTHDKAACPKCSEAEPEFDRLAYSYRLTQTSESSEKPIFFLRAQYKFNQRAFKKYGLTMAPLLYYVKPTNDGSDDQRALEKVELFEEDKFDLYRRGTDADYLADFVMDKAGVTVPIYRSPLAKIGLIVLVLVSLGGLGYAVISNFDFFLGLARTKVVWVAASFFLYWMSISGMVYCIIRNPPMFHQDYASKRISIFHPQSRSQFVFEGLYVGALNVLAASAVITLVLYCPTIKDSTVRTNAALGAIAAFVMFYYFYESAYKLKNPWYRG